MRECIARFYFIEFLMWRERRVIIQRFLAEGCIHVMHIIRFFSWRWFPQLSFCWMIKACGSRGSKIDGLFYFPYVRIFLTFSDKYICSCVGTCQRDTLVPFSKMVHKHILFLYAFNSCSNGDGGWLISQHFKMILRMIRLA